MSLIKRIFQATYNEITKPSSFTKGEEFEEFVINELFPKHLYKILEKTHNYNETKYNFIESVLNPDIKFQCKKTKKVFWIECKFRTDWDTNNMIDAVSENQLKRHQKIKEPVFFVIGLGENPKKIEDLYLIPISKIYPKLYPNYAENFSINEIPILNIF